MTKTRKDGNLAAKKDLAGRSNRSTVKAGTKRKRSSVDKFVKCTLPKRVQPSDKRINSSSISSAKKREKVIKKHRVNRGKIQFPIPVKSGYGGKRMLEDETESIDIDSDDSDTYYTFPETPLALSTPSHSKAKSQTTKYTKSTAKSASATAKSADKSKRNYNRGSKKINVLKSHESNVIEATRTKRKSVIGKQINRTHDVVAKQLTKTDIKAARQSKKLETKKRTANDRKLKVKLVQLRSATTNESTPTSSAKRAKQLKRTNDGLFASKALTVICDEQNVRNAVMAPPPSPFLGIRNSNARSVARIPISPYTRSPSGTSSSNVTSHQSNVRTNRVDTHYKSTIATAPIEPEYTTVRVTRSSLRKAVRMVESSSTHESAGNSPNKQRSTGNSSNKQGSAENSPNKQGSAGNSPNKQVSAGNSPNKQGSAGNSPNKQGSVGSSEKYRRRNVAPMRDAGELTPYSRSFRHGGCVRHSIRPPSPTTSERRLSIRQTESAFKYKDILVKKTYNFTQVILNTEVGRQKNTLTVKALQELTAVLNNAKYDDTSHVILITGSDNGTFCSGLDLTYLTSGDIHLAARTLSDTLGEFVRAALSFPKPLVAAVNGEAIGCGVAILPLCDVVYASDKATFFTPYTQLGQVPEAGLSRSLAQIIGMALANEMLMAGRMLTALEAYQMGLVAQVFWPTSMMQEVIPRITNMATSCSSRVLNATKSLIRSEQRERLLAASHTEASMLAEIWPTPECQNHIKMFLHHCRSL